MHIAYPRYIFRGRLLPQILPIKVGEIHDPPKSQISMKKHKKYENLRYDNTLKKTIFDNQTQRK